MDRTKKEQIAKELCWSHGFHWENINEAARDRFRRETDKILTIIKEPVQALSAPDMPVLTRDEDVARWAISHLEIKREHIPDIHSMPTGWHREAQHDADQSCVDAYIKAHLPSLALKWQDSPEGKKAGYVKLSEDQTAPCLYLDKNEGDGKDMVTIDYCNGRASLIDSNFKKVEEMTLTDADFKALEQKGYVNKNTTHKILSKAGEKAADEAWGKLSVEDRALFCLSFLDEEGRNG